MHGRAGFALLRKRVLLAANPQAITFRNPITKSAPEPDNVSTTEQIPLVSYVVDVPKRVEITAGQRVLSVIFLATHG